MIGQTLLTEIYQSYYEEHQRKEQTYFGKSHHSTEKQEYIANAIMKYLVAVYGLLD